VTIGSEPLSLRRVALAGVIFVVGLFLFVTCRQANDPASGVQVGVTSTLLPSPSVSPTTLLVLASPSPTLSPSATGTPVARPTDSPSPAPTLPAGQSLLQATLPIRDPDALALRFRGGGYSDQDIEAPIRNNFQLGDSDTFWVSDITQSPPKQFQITATVTYMTGHAYWWLQDGFSLSDSALMASAEQFENHTYPTTRAYFGSEWSPGIDGDARIHVVMGNIPGVGGYYASSNEYSRLADPYSNQREMFLINLNALQPGNQHFDGVLAHEFQHMIHWRQDPNEDGWLNEGLSELAQYLNGYGDSNFLGNYLQNPDTQLTDWQLGSGVNYGYSFLLSAYLLDKFGPDFITGLVANSGNGIEGINQMLRQRGLAQEFDVIFADFLIANFLNDPALEQGQWGYQLNGLPAINLSPPELETRHTTFPVESTATVSQYGADYIEISGQNLTGPADLTVTFQGAETVAILNNQPYSGRYQWYSNRGDAIDTTLTRPFNLSGLEQAKLNFWAWYDIEASWDYAYVTISTDGGQTWQILPATTTTAGNEVGKAYGPGFSGASDGWVEQMVDLTPFTGQEILLRFEYITDDAVNMTGFALDDISIPELSYFHDGEAGDDGWLAEGFVRIDNRLPQEYAIQMIEFWSTGEVTVQPFLLDAHNQGRFRLQGVGRELERAVMVVAALAPVTTNPADYTYAIAP
jgi:hypothetical protein